MTGRKLSDALGQLTEGQKTCLRLVGQGMSSKEIALLTGLAPQTVDTYIKAALGRLGTTNRREASRMLAALEESHKLGSPPQPIASEELSLELGAAAESGAWGRWFLPPPVGGRLNRLDAAQRTFAILRVSAVGIAVAIALVLVLTGVLKTFR